MTKNSTDLTDAEIANWANGRPSNPRTGASPRTQSRRTDAPEQDRLPDWLHIGGRVFVARPSVDCDLGGRGS